MLRQLAVLLFLAVPAAVHAGADCTANPESEWKSEAEARAKFEAEGYQIKKFKVDGHCYEIYGYDQQGRKAEIYFDTKTLAVVKSEIDD